MLHLEPLKKKNNAARSVEVINQEITHKTVNEEDNITKIERLAKLKDQGVITEQEFEDKKKELLK